MMVGHVLLPRGVSKGIVTEMKPSPLILLIEENEQLRRNMADILMLDTYQVVIASNTREGLALLRTNSVLPDLIILGVYDTNQADYSWFLDAVRAEVKGQAVPLLFVGGIPQSTPNNLYAKFQVAGYLTKPFATDDLLAAVKQALGY